MSSTNHDIGTPCQPQTRQDNDHNHQIRICLAHHILVPIGPTVAPMVTKIGKQMDTRQWDLPVPVRFQITRKCHNNRQHRRKQKQSQRRKIDSKQNVVGCWLLQQKSYDKSSPKVWHFSPTVILIFMYIQWLKQHLGMLCSLHNCNWGFHTVPQDSPLPEKPDLVFPEKLVDNNFQKLFYATVLMKHPFFPEIYVTWLRKWLILIQFQRGILQEALMDIQEHITTKLGMLIWTWCSHQYSH